MEVMVLKRKKEAKRAIVDEEDKISQLPIALIHHIYSFLPTKCVLSTCSLSKRWKALSNSILILDFRKWRIRHEKGYAVKVPKLMNFVGTTLFVHENPKIQKFLIDRVDDCFDETRVHRWIRTVITRKVEELHLSLTSEKPFIFPLSFFTCDSLVVLDLDYYSILSLPGRISFPRLKILRLSNMEFVDENLTGKLFSNCPVLEELSLIYCHFQNLKVLCITSHTLKHLSIMKGSLLHSTLKICAPNLLTINYGAEMPVDFVLDSFPLLVGADIKIYDYQDYTRGYALIKLYKKICNVKLIKTCVSTYRGLSAANILLSDLSTFCNLVRLEVRSFSDR